MSQSHSLSMNAPGCPCGSGHPFSHCCEPFIREHSLPATPEQLMRSRYTAFTKEAVAYLVASWHPETREPDLAEQLGNSAGKLRWLHLQIEQTGLNETRDGAPQGWVQFTARYLEGDQLGELHERSLFLYEHGRWYYHSGNATFSRLAAIGRNTPCPCLSGSKFKRCCGR